MVLSLMIKNTCTDIFHVSSDIKQYGVNDIVNVQDDEAILVYSKSA